MPTIACRTCGRVIYTAAPIEALFAEERRCPRCGAYLESERREDNRRHTQRRANPPADAGPPNGIERRVEERRQGKRRRGDGGPFGT
jgi:phage FluMu protein Com